MEIVEGEVNVGQAARGKHGFPPAQIPISGAGLRRLVRWPKPAAFSKAWCEINNVNGLKPRQNICHKMRRMNNLTIRDLDLPMLSFVRIQFGQFHTLPALRLPYPTLPG